MDRRSRVVRKTGETDITVALNLDGSGKSRIDTGIGFFNHMLELFSKHGFFDLEIKADGDTMVDCHHTVEDVGIVLGQALREALGDKKGIRRYGISYIPMDESLSMAVVDISGRPFLIFEADFVSDRLGMMDTQMVEEFFRAVAFNAGITLHIRTLYGSNDHHKCESLFKAFGKALDEALKIDERITGVLSTKGIL